MRVFLDTNVLVSAFATRGLSSNVFRLVLAEHEVIIGQIVIDEFQHVLAHKTGLPEKVAGEVLALLKKCRVLPTDDTDPGGDVSDPSDTRVLATALAAEAEALVTGNQELLSVQE